MEDKENVLHTFTTDTDNLGVVQAKYEVKTGPVLGSHSGSVEGQLSI